MRAEQTTQPTLNANGVGTVIHSSPQPGGIQLRCLTKRALADDTQSFLSQPHALELRQYVELSAPASSPHGFEQSFHLRADLAGVWAPGLDTTGLQLHFARGASQTEAGLEREIVATMLLSPLAFDLPSHAELAAAVRMRRNIVVAARKTALVSVP